MGKKKKKRKKKENPKVILVFLIMSILLCSGMFYAYFSDDTEEKTVISGVFDNYSETKKRVNKSRKTYYLLYLNGVKYNIPRIYINALNKEAFLADVKSGDSLTLIIGDGKSIYQITKAETTYMDPVKLKEEIESNNFVGLILGCFFLACTFYLGYIYMSLKANQS